ncbi:maleylpyruvate isomerase N-terminal domain-containing protein [Streptomyces sp. H27-C3]|uniref:maleylpyruvate isomerase N-terminal domain-containing protein n=1 Tax=Streptomyces sp. H27-C3 TaxID=3046305 RepID=UPI0024BAA970|nr:maleylpyruvate isomerase N-terminal domain-containing protein [Streptomyces sp. H27-C3]MDJ0463406.1 maleylpyruvate isomerase N-terminal domain-containing protein [Streptomyces sp. H27-C3]
MDGEAVLVALRAESKRLYEKVAGLPEGEWDRPSPCAPWTVREVFAHLTTAVGRVDSMLAESESESESESEPGPGPEGEPEAEPEASEMLVTAAGYYAPNERFSSMSNGARVDAAQESAVAYADGRSLAEHFDSVWRSVAATCAKEPPERRIRTRHGDPMLLSEFLVTRVVEVCVHGFDVAAGLGHEPWPTEEAAEVVARLLLGGRPYETGHDAGGGYAGPAAGFGWDRTAFLRKATGRLPMTTAERMAAEGHGLHWLTLG